MFQTSKDFLIRAMKSVNVIKPGREECKKCHQKVLHSRWRFNGVVVVQCFSCDHVRVRDPVEDDDCQCGLV